MLFISRGSFLYLDQPRIWGVPEEGPERGALTHVRPTDPSTPVLKKEKHESMDPENENEETKEAADYIAAIKELKENTVPKSEYEKKVAENRQLLDTLVSGGQISKEEEEEMTKSSDDYAAELVKPHTNLDYAKIALRQREKAIEEGKGDPFVPRGLNFHEGQASDAENAEKAAELLQSCVDDCGDDPEAFLALFQSRVRDNPQLKMRQAAQKANRRK